MNRNLLFTALIAVAIATQSSAAAPDDPDIVGAVYAMTNNTENNEIVVFDRHADGTLTESGTYSTDGQGGFAGDPADALGSEGALVLNEDKSRLYAVNAGSDSISVLKVLPDGLELVQTRDSHPTGASPSASPCARIFSMYSTPVATAVSRGSTSDRQAT
jgi:hypothetical protein